jgi:hypothetical protein
MTLPQHRKALRTGVAYGKKANLRQFVEQAHVVDAPVTAPDNGEVGHGGDTFSEFVRKMNKR